MVAESFQVAVIVVLTLYLKVDYHAFLFFLFFHVSKEVLAKVEAERDHILQELEEREKSLLNLDDYVEYGLTLKDNMLKLWQIANLSHKRQLQNLIFPEGLVWSKENEDIEPLSVNDFLFVFNLKSANYKQNKNGQTADFSNLSALAPPVGLEPTTL